MQQNHNTLVIPLQRNQISQLKIMDELTEIYKRIEYLRNNGVKMKEIADRIDMAPSVLSALYSSVLPAYIDLLKTRTPDEALDDSLALVNNVSKKRLLNNVASMKLLLQEMEPEQQSEAENGNSFIKLLGKEMKESVRDVFNYSGIYLSYSLSSSTDSLKIEPYMICASENSEYVKVGVINAYKSMHWGSGIISNHQNSYLMFNERDLPQFALVTIYLQLPHYEFPNMLKGLYLCLDYNHNPIARRIVMVKQLDSTVSEDGRETGSEGGVDTGTGSVLQLYLPGRGLYQDVYSAFAEVGRNGFGTGKEIVNDLTIISDRIYGKTGETPFLTGRPGHFLDTKTAY